MAIILRANQYKKGLKWSLNKSNLIDTVKCTPFIVNESTESASVNDITSGFTLTSCQNQTVSLPLANSYLTKYGHASWTKAPTCIWGNIELATKAYKAIHTAKITKRIEVARPVTNVSASFSVKGKSYQIGHGNKGWGSYPYIEYSGNMNGNNNKTIRSWIETNATDVVNDWANSSNFHNYVTDALTRAPWVRRINRATGSNPSSANMSYYSDIYCQWNGGSGHAWTSGYYSKYYREQVNEVSGSGGTPGDCRMWPVTFYDPTGTGFWDVGKYNTTKQEQALKVYTGTISPSVAVQRVDDYHYDVTVELPVAVVNCMASRYNYSNDVVLHMVEKGWSLIDSFAYVDLIKSVSISFSGLSYITDTYEVAYSYETDTTLTTNLVDANTITFDKNQFIRYTTWWYGYTDSAGSHNYRWEQAMSLYLLSHYHTGKYVVEFDMLGNTASELGLGLNSEIYIQLVTGDFITNQGRGIVFEIKNIRKEFRNNEYVWHIKALEGDFSKSIVEIKSAKFLTYSKYHTLTEANRITGNDHLGFGAESIPVKPEIFTPDNVTSVSVRYNVTDRSKFQIDIKDNPRIAGKEAVSYSDLRISSPTGIKQIDSVEIIENVDYYLSIKGETFSPVPLDEDVALESITVDIRDGEDQPEEPRLGVTLEDGIAVVNPQKVNEDTNVLQGYLMLDEFTGDMNKYALLMVVKLPLWAEGEWWTSSNGASFNWKGSGYYTYGQTAVHEIPNDKYYHRAMINKQQGDPGNPQYKYEMIIVHPTAEEWKMGIVPVMFGTTSASRQILRISTMQVQYYLIEDEGAYAEEAWDYIRANRIFETYYSTRTYALPDVGVSNYSWKCYDAAKGCYLVKQPYPVASKRVVYCSNYTFTNMNTDSNSKVEPSMAGDEIHVVNATAADPSEWDGCIADHDNETDDSIWYPSGQGETPVWQDIYIYPNTSQGEASVTRVKSVDFSISGPGELISHTWVATGHTGTYNQAYVIRCKAQFRNGSFPRTSAYLEITYEASYKMTEVEMDENGDVWNNEWRQRTLTVAPGDQIAFTAATLGSDVWRRYNGDSALEVKWKILVSFDGGNYWEPRPWDGTFSYNLTSGQNFYMDWGTDTQWPNYSGEVTIRPILYVKCRKIKNGTDGYASADCFCVINDNSTH